MKRLLLLGLAAVFCAGILAGCTRRDDELPGQQTRSYPNVVLIIMDTLRADKMGCYGFHDNTSPELDEMAKRGVVFTTVVSQCSWTRPSIGSMLTSLYPRTLGLYKQKNQVLADRFLSLPEILQSCGFRTIGLTANPNINSAFNFHRGFDIYLDSDVVWHWMDRKKGQPTEQTGRLPSAKELFDRALELVQSSAGRPHYVQVNVMEMHEYKKTGRKSLVRPEFSEMFPAARNRGYLQSLRQLSTDIGGFVKALTSLPGWDDTLFVLTSDHGEGLDDHPDVWHGHLHGGYLYESNIMVPVILYNPNGSLSTQTIDERVRLLDLMPTVLDYLDISIPDSAIGVSLLPLIRHETDSLALPEYFVAETQFGVSDKIAVYSSRWKYIENRDAEFVAGRFEDQGVNPVELQAVGEKENGRKTDRINSHSAAADPLRSFLQRWESAFPKAEPTPRKKAVSAAERKQLESLGYLR